MVILRGMGMETDQEILQLIGSDETVTSLFLPSLEECSRLGIFTQTQALTYIGSKSRVSRRTYTSRKPKEEEARDVLAGVVLAHVPVKQYNFRPKCVYLALMIRRVINAMTDKVGASPLLGGG